MSSVWEAPASGDAEWEKQDNVGPEEVDGDDQGWTSNADADGWPSTDQGMSLLFTSSVL